MARGNQREQARKKNEEKKASQSKAHGMSGSELAKAKLVAAEKMRQKQAEADAKKAAGVAKK